MKQVFASQYHGFTLIEVLVTMGIFLIVTGGAVSILITSIRSNAVIWEQLATQNDGRQVLQEVVDDIRRAEVSSIGSYPIALAEPETIILYANIDNDPDRERIRYWHADERLYKGVTKPSGSPLRYTTSTEVIKILAENVKNTEQGTPVFEYYEESYIGDGAAMSYPLTLTDIRMVRVSLELEEDPTQTPVPLFVESIAHIRNVKAN